MGLLKNFNCSKYWEKYMQPHAKQDITISSVITPKYNESHLVN